MGNGTAPSPDADPGTLFLGGYRRRVLETLLLHPGAGVHLRELARRTRTQPGTLRRELRLLVEAGVVSRERVGNLTLYRADPACVIHDELCAILLKTTSAARLLRAALAPLGTGIALAYLREPTPAQGAEFHELVVIGNVAAEAVDQALGHCPPALRATVHALVYAPAALRKKARKNNPALARVLKGGKLFLLGRDADLRELTGKRRAAEGP